MLSYIYDNVKNIKLSLIDFQIFEMMNKEG